MRRERLLNTVSQHELLLFSRMCNQLLWVVFLFSFAAFKSAASRIHPEDLTIRNARACYNLGNGGVLSEQVEQTGHYRGNTENDSLQQLGCWNRNNHNKDGELTLLVLIWFSNQKHGKMLSRTNLGREHIAGLIIYVVFYHIVRSPAVSLCYITLPPVVTCQTHYFCSA